MNTEKVLVLRTCDSLRLSHGGFTWPEGGPVESPDWNPTPVCGQGLHGWLWGEGDGSLGRWDADAKWLVVEVAASDIVDLGGKVKFPRGVVVHCGDRKSATEYLAAHSSASRAIVGGTSTSGDRGTSTSGDGGTSTSGDRGTSTSGDRGTSTSGDRGTSTSGYGGTSTSGYGGTSTSGYGGTSTSGDGGTSTSGDRGVIAIFYWDEPRRQYRRAIGAVGENGIEPNVPYRVEDGKLVKAPPCEIDQEQGKRCRLAAGHQTKCNLIAAEAA